MHVLNPDMEAVTLYVSCMSWPLHPQALPCWAPVSIKQLFSFFKKKVFASSAGTGGQNYCCKNTNCHTSNKEHGTRRGDEPKIVSASLLSRPISASFHHFAFVRVSGEAGRHRTSRVMPRADAVAWNSTFSLENGTKYQ
jgi:hypothetical protein